MAFQKYSIEKNELVNLFQKWRHLLLLWKGNIYTYVLDTWHSLFQLCVGGYDLLLTGCDLFLSGCGWVWVSVTFFWLGVSECDLFLAWCGWVWVGGCGWVSARFITAPIKCLIFNPKTCNIFLFLVYTSLIYLYKFNKLLLWISSIISITTFSTI